MSILVVGDGPRDKEALPTLVRRILEVEISTQFEVWNQVRVYKQKGTIYARKLQYLTRRALANNLTARVIVVDTDKNLRKRPRREKLRMLRVGLDEERQNHLSFPTALGEATPHFDIWLLDDAVAVRQALQLPSKSVPTAAKIDNPKAALTELIDRSDKEFEQVSDALGEIAQRLSTKRCGHRQETGFADFESDLRKEIKPALSKSSN